MPKCDICGRESKNRIYEKNDGKDICRDCLDELTDLKKLFNEDKLNAIRNLLTENALEKLVVDEL